MSSTNKKSANTNLSETQVLEYLAQHPDFFQRHEEALDSLKIPHNTGAISLIEHQVSRLRTQKKQQDEQLKSLITAARTNEQIISQVQRFTLEMIQTHSLEDIFVTCDETLRNHFKADFTGIKLIGDKEDHPNFIPSNSPFLKSFIQLFKNKRPLCGRITDKQRLIMFGENESKIKSAVLVPLQSTHNIGVVALGSTDESRFHPGMGILFLHYLGEIITASINRESS